MTQREQELRLRELSREDLALVSEIAEQAGLALDAAGVLDHGQEDILVLTRGGQAVAFVCLIAMGPEAEITDLAVSQPLRRGGLGKRLLLELFAVLRQRGVRRVLLEVSEANQAARALYARAGFVEVGRRPGYYSSGADAILMDCCLSPSS